MCRKELEVLKEINRPSGFYTQMYTYAGRFHVRLVNPYGITIAHGEFDSFEDADVYFSSQEDELVNSFYS